MPDPRPDTVRLVAERFAAGGEAIAHAADGRIVFVRGAVPGDEVDVAITDEHEAWLRGVAERVVVASDERVEPPCPQRRAGCGGCDWQHLDTGAQLAAKADVVRDALRRTARLADADVHVGASVPSAGYRTTVRVVGGPGRRPSFRMERSHDTVVADECLVAHPLLRPVIATLRLDTDLDLVLRASVATGEVTARWDRGRGRVDGLPGHVATGADAVVHETVGGHRLRVSAGSFFQSGPAAAELLVAAVRRSAPELAHARTAVDAYAGVGLFAVAAVPADARVLTIESSRSAVDDCRVNLERRDAVVERGQVGRWRPPDEPVDVVVADPARSGLGRPGSAALVATRAPVIVLVSCDPVAMARDTALLHRAGYRHAGTEVLDLFPHTHHVECVTRFERAD